MELIITYTSVDNKKLELRDGSYKSHEFKKHVGYITLIDTHVPTALFEHNPALKSVVIPEGVTHIGVGAFDGCTGLRNVTIPDSVTDIGNSAFESCLYLTSVQIPSNVTRIGWSAFEGCHGLTSIKIPSSVTHIGCCAFCACTGLRCVELSNGVMIIRDSAFRGCTSLTEAAIPNSVKYIGAQAFEDCPNLKKVRIPNSVTYIGTTVFDGCKALPCRQINWNHGSILAYKGFNFNMSCKGFEYEVGHSYHEPKAKVCNCGFHACLNPLDVLAYYPMAGGTRFALVELGGEVDFSQLSGYDSDTKVAATDIKIVKELTVAELIVEFNRLNNL